MNNLNKSRVVIVVGLIVFLIGMRVREQIINSQIIGQNYRYSMVVAGSEGEVEYVSFDSEEKEILVIPWPGELEISSRSVGSYRVRDLYQLGSYENMSGEFVRQKVQGYMKAPIMSYVEIEGELSGLRSTLMSVVMHGGEVSEMSRLDAVVLFWRSWCYDSGKIEMSELLRAGVLIESDNGYEYQEGRLHQFLGKRIFDWGVGNEKLNVAVINQSEMGGLAADVAGFLGNAGLSVVAVRNGVKNEKLTYVTISNEMDDEQKKRIVRMLDAWFGWSEIEVGDTSEYRAEIVVELGEDAEKLF